MHSIPLRAVLVAIALGGSAVMAQELAPVIVVVRGAAGDATVRFPAPGSLAVLRDSHDYERLRRRARESARAAMQARQLAAARLAERLRAAGAARVRSLLGGSMVSAWMTPRVRAEAARDLAVLAVMDDPLLDAQLDVSTAAIYAQGFWANNVRGSDNTSYEAGILDSGIDVGHPGLSAAAFVYSIVFAQAAGDPSFNDAYTPDDLAGHGTPVTGILMGRGSATWTNHRGVAPGLANAVNLKSAFRRSNGSIGLYFSDAVDNIDWGVFGAADDIDSLNFSYGVSTGFDDTSLSRFMDAVVDDLGIPVVVAAGNGGPAARTLVDPAIAYNVLSIGSMFDAGSTTRADDVISVSSARGPTAGGRKKPDLVAPGGYIRAPTANWENVLDYQDYSGTSYAAPHVTGAVHLLMDALGPPVDPRVLRALLINNADDWGTHEWNATYGWGYVNLDKTWVNRDAWFAHQVSPRGQSGDFKLYRATMSPMDNITLAWNRHVDYAGGGAYPGTWYGLNDLDLFLYDEDDGTQLDCSTSGIDNIEQVSITQGQYEVVAKVQCQDSSLGAVSQESYAIAGPRGIAFPANLPSPQVDLYAPAPVVVGETFRVLASVHNSGDFRCFSPTLALAAASGFEVLGGGERLIRLERSGAPPRLVVFAVAAPPNSATTTASCGVSASGYGEIWTGSANVNLRSDPGGAQRLQFESVATMELGNGQFTVTATVRNTSVTPSASTLVSLLLDEGTSLSTGQTFVSLGSLAPGQRSPPITWDLVAAPEPRFAILADGLLSGTPCRAVHASFDPSLPPGVASYGSSTPGCSGPLAVGAERTPRVGEGDFAVTCRGAAPDATGFVCFSGAALSQPLLLQGVWLWIDLANPVVFSWVVGADSSGRARAQLPIPSVPAFAGISLSAQFGWLDACGPAGFASSDALTLTIQP
jgi:hypothetical protein